MTEKVKEIYLLLLSHVCSQVSRVLCFVLFSCRNPIWSFCLLECCLYLWYQRGNMMNVISGFKASVTHHFSSLLTDQSGVATPNPGACGVGKYNPTIIWKEGTQKYHWTSVLTRWDSEHFGWQVNELRGLSLVGWCDQLNQTKGKWRGRIVRACSSFPKLIPVEYCWWKGLRVAAC